MKMIYQAGSVTFEAEVATGKQAFELIAKMSELFPDEPCGCCKGTHIRPSVRKSGAYTFYEMACADCNAKLSFGQAKEGGALFLKRWDKENNRPLPNRGWSVYQKEGQGYDKPAASAPASQNAGEETGEVPF